MRLIKSLNAVVFSRLKQSGIATWRWPVARPSKGLCHSHRTICPGLFAQVQICCKTDGCDTWARYRRCKLKALSMNAEVVFGTIPSDIPQIFNNYDSLHFVSGFILARLPRVFYEEREHGFNSLRHGEYNFANGEDRPGQ